MARIPVMSVAADVRTIAHELIREHHSHLIDANVLYLFTDQERKRCDRVRLGSAAKLNSLQRFLASGLDGVEQGPDFIILIDSNLWDTAGRAARVALVDHELCHCTMFVKELAERPQVWRRINREFDMLPIDDEKYEWRWGMRGHDIEEFGEVLYRHGFWKDGPERAFGEIVAMQLKMPEKGVARA